MKQLVTKGIILSRTDYGEADRIITLLTPDYGKLRLMAKGVRRIKSKLAGGIELFSVSNITFIQGRGEVGTLISTRLIRHWRHIIEKIERVQLGYELIKMLNKATEDEPETEYFELLEHAFEALDEIQVNEALIQVWFAAQLLRFGGHTPNLQTDISGAKLDAAAKYEFSFEEMAFAPRPNGHFTAGHIKFLRLIFSSNQPKVLSKIQGAEVLVADCAPIIQTVFRTYIRV
jgi:DNA repair protein RecO (recombination protein O)